MEQIRSEVAGMSHGPGSGGAFSRRPDFDERRLKVTPYNGDRTQWRDFAWTLSSFIGRESPSLKKVMAKAEVCDHEISDKWVVDNGISLELDGALHHMLVNNMAQGSEAKSLLRSMEGKPGLEAWKRFWKDAKPKGGRPRNS